MLSVVKVRVCNIAMKLISGSSQYRSKANMTGSENYTAFFKKRENAPFCFNSN